MEGKVIAQLVLKTYVINFKQCYYSPGRRLDELNPGKYQTTMNPARPVLIEGHWQDPSLDEQIKHDTVHQLQVSSTTCDKSS